MLKMLTVIAAFSLSGAATAQNDVPTPPQRGGLPSPEQILGFMDADKDGFIAKDEAKGPLAQNFDYVDADKDAKISLDELKTAMTAMRPPEPPKDGTEAAE